MCVISLSFLYMCPVYSTPLRMRYFFVISLVVSRVPYPDCACVDVLWVVVVALALAWLSLALEHVEMKSWVKFWESLVVLWRVTCVRPTLVAAVNVRYSARAL